jgi:hypothetical protein
MAAQGHPVSRIGYCGESLTKALSLQTANLSCLVIVPESGD